MYPAVALTVSVVFESTLTRQAIRLLKCRHNVDPQSMRALSAGLCCGSVGQQVAFRLSEPGGYKQRNDACQRCDAPCGIGQAMPDVARRHYIG